MSTLTRREVVHAAVNSQRGELRALLDALVAQPSISWSKPGVDTVAEIALAAMPAGFLHQRMTQSTLGDHHVLRYVGKPGSPRIILSGHLDTMCPESPDFNSVVKRGDKLFGPGVMDMKGGDVVLIGVLRCLETIGALDDFSITVIFNSDEELGSPTSRPIFEAMRGQADLALVFEASSPQGSVVTTRRGVYRARLQIHGIEHHFGMLRGVKVSALEEAAHKTLQIEALNREDGSVAMNVGRIEGGLVANKVAHEATLDFETRCWDAALHEQTIEHVKKLATTPIIQGCRIELEELSYRPPMKLRDEHQWFLELAQNVAKQLELPLEAEQRGGVSDACWLSHAGIPTLDGFGPRGDGDFTPQEYCFAESLYERIELVTNILLEAQQRIRARCDNSTSIQINT
jgi:glutamate carboxypeptidase